MQLLLLPRFNFAIIISQEGWRENKLFLIKLGDYSSQRVLNTINSFYSPVVKSISFEKQDLSVTFYLAFR